MLRIYDPQWAKLFLPRLSVGGGVNDERLRNEDEFPGEKLDIDPF
jgi:hypothetical protein